MNPILNEGEQATVSPENLARLAAVRDWESFLKLPFSLQQVARKVCPELPRALEQRHFARINAGVPR